MLKIHGQKKILYLTLFMILLALASPALGYQGKLVKVLDGDTIEVLHAGQVERIRLQGIDAPEKGQPFGNKAKRFVLDVAAGKIVDVKPISQDRYGRTVGEVILPSGESLNRLLVKEGYAWWYRRYSDDASLGNLEKTARASTRGLWADPDPVSPWEWRRGIRAAKNKIDKNAPGSNRCEEKRYCKEMASCEEALFFLQKCGLSRLDGDGDGVPCEALCRQLF